ncbi:MAG: glutathione S-transferase [Rhizorhabdus sp.]|nr:glutathione S-transferase [Rhizorhabdus sp.]
MSKPVLTISSRNYSSWSLRGWLLCKLAGLDVTEEQVSIDSPGQRAELLLLSPSVLVPRLTHDGASIWDTLAIAEYLHEKFPDAGLYPQDGLARAHCRSISGEIHSGFHNLRSALPMNLKARNDSFRLFAGARPDIERIQAIWDECLSQYGGPWLMGATPTVADAMFAPVATRFITYAIPLDAACRGYCTTIAEWAPMIEWTKAALAEPEEMEELDAEF